ncbi:MAG: EamA family transporter, partial [Acidithiobacillus ferriphilus]|nr:EamA family transporter [Acidithiobacillus ferriphilus]
LFLNLVPVFAVGFSILFLQERLASRQWLGVLVILAGIVWTSIARSPPTAENAESTDEIKQS